MSSSRKREGGRAAAPPDAYDSTLALLSRREHSRRELDRKLARKGIDAPSRNEALDRAREGSWQDDARFAQSLARQRAASGYGPRYLLAELKSHGIGGEAAKAALEAGDWDAALEAAVRKGQRGSDRAARGKLAAFLSRRGFEAEAIRRATRCDPAEG